MIHSISGRFRFVYEEQVLRAYARRWTYTGSNVRELLAKQTTVVVFGAEMRSDDFDLKATASEEGWKRDYSFSMATRKTWTSMQQRETPLRPAFHRMTHIPMRREISEEMCTSTIF